MQMLRKPSMNNPTHSSNNFNSRPGALSIQNVVSTIARPNDPKNTTAANAIKTAFQNIFKFPFRQDNKPDGSSNVSGQMPQTVPYITTQTYRPVQPFYEVIGDQPPQKVSDYQWEDETSNSASEADETDNSTVHMEKQIFGHRHTAEQQTQMEAAKQGGIIIQRLKVRKGGIAIAGPGGVATAGSGGTAIVGPGGYALTHPRSLTIAGPGAKIIAIPSNVDLKDALQRTNPSDQSIPREAESRTSMTNLSDNEIAIPQNNGKKQNKRKMLKERSKTTPFIKLPSRRTVDAPSIQSGDFKSDTHLLKAMQQINPEFVIEDILPGSGQHILGTLRLKSKPHEQER
ncbi:uncharacterized protein [Eurosta solidaginis]|uniref:uncharacterized protein isoform X3 n=1 Tax=Eurosta solidaginis TaxID=178769 RepID=UPI00353089A8